MLEYIGCLFHSIILNWYSHWIALRENVFRKTPKNCMGTSLVSCRSSLRPIHWHSGLCKLDPSLGRVLLRYNIILKYVKSWSFFWGCDEILIPKFTVVSTNINLSNSEGFVFNQHQPMEFWWFSVVFWRPQWSWLKKKDSDPRCSGSCPGNCRTARVWCSKLTSLALEHYNEVPQRDPEGIILDFGLGYSGYRFPIKTWNMCTYICTYVYVNI